MVMRAKKRTLTCLRFACLIVTFALCTSRAYGQTSLPFTDTFTALDQHRWFVSDGWSNGDWAANDWSRDQVYARGGTLHIELERRRGREKPFTSGEVQSRERFQYGYFESRLRAPRGSGLVTGFFSYFRHGSDESTWDEIDIEILGRDTRAVQFTYFRNGERRGVTKNLWFDASRDFHTYAFDWQPGRIRWYVDGRMLHEVEGAADTLPQRPQQILVSLWNSNTLGDWLGPIPITMRRAHLLVDCLAYAPTYQGAALCS